MKFVFCLFLTFSFIFSKRNIWVYNVLYIGKPSPISVHNSVKWKKVIHLPFYLPKGIFKLIKNWKRIFVVFELLLFFFNILRKSKRESDLMNQTGSRVGWIVTCKILNKTFPFRKLHNVEQMIERAVAIETIRTKLVIWTGSSVGENESPQLRTNPNQ